MCLFRDIALFCGFVGLSQFLEVNSQVFHTRFGNILNAPDILLVTIKYHSCGDCIFGLILSTSGKQIMLFFLVSTSYTLSVLVFK